VIRARAIGGACRCAYVAAFALVVALLTWCSSTRVVEARDGVLDLRSWSGEEMVVPHGEYRGDWDTLDPREGAGDRFTVPGNIGGIGPRVGSSACSRARAAPS
jgi:hypothetical protein